METLRAYLKNPLIAVLAGVLVGLLLGLIIGWGIWPVTWVNGGPGQLSPQWRTDFLKMAIDSYGTNRDVALAKERYEALGSGKKELLQQVAQQPGSLSPAAIAEFSAIAAGEVPPVGAQPGAATSAVTTPGTALTPGTPEAITPGAPAAITTPGAVETSAAAVTTPGAEKPAAGGSSWMLYLGLACIVMLILFGALAYFTLFRNKFAGSTSGPSAATQAAEARKSVVMTDYSAAGTVQPTAQFMASYKLGDDLFDDSFSIDSQSGEFLGECGVGISENIGVGEPKKVSAFEVWLFDKNDIQTVTKVLMSPHAYADSSVRQRLEAKGETVQASPGAEFVLETQTLTMVARVVDMDYGEGAMPQESYFDHLLLELAIWQKPSA